MELTEREQGILYQEAFDAGVEQGHADMAHIVAERDRLRDALIGMMRQHAPSAEYLAEWYRAMSLAEAALQEVDDDE